MTARQRALIVGVGVCIVAVIATVIFAATYDSGSKSTSPTTSTRTPAGSSTSHAATTRNTTSSSGGGPSTTDVSTTTALDPGTTQSEVTSFLERFGQALRTSDATFLFDHLHPSVIRAYGADTCTASVQLVHDPTADYKLIQIQRTGTFSWKVGNQTLDIPNAIIATVEVVNQGVGSRVDLHLVWFNGKINYFRDCTR